MATSTSTPVSAMLTTSALRLAASTLRAHTTDVAAYTTVIARLQQLGAGDDDDVDASTWIRDTEKTRGEHAVVLERKLRVAKSGLIKEEIRVGEGVRACVRACVSVSACMFTAKRDRLCHDDNNVNTQLAHNQLGMHYYTAGDIEQAARHYSKAR